MPMPTYLVAFVISDYQIDTVQGFSPITNTEVRTGIAEGSFLTQQAIEDSIIRVPGPDFIINNGLADYALNKSMILIDAFSEVK